MSDDAKLKEAKEHVGKLKHFYQHLISYAVVNVVLIIINLVTSPTQLWFYWVTIFWGIGIAVQAFKTFGPGAKLNKNWEDKKVKEYMDKN
tara:strand:- start:239049 stop:239318 length:270 start_codon:yes stop_codon:yes gene_type:complete